MSEVPITINSEINELYSKTKVSQEFINNSNNPLELKIYVYKDESILFDSFQAKIGESISIKSKIIKKEKVEIKYNDSIASGNAAIFITEDTNNERKYIIHMGNIPPHEKILFETNFIHFTQYSKKYKFELFRNFPIFIDDSGIFKNSDLKGTININVKHPILNISKKLSLKNINITEEKYLDEEKKKYLINYEIKNLSELDINNLQSLPSSKIYFDLDMDYPMIYTQDSSIDLNKKNYCIKYGSSVKDILSIEDLDNFPSIFIFLVDQSFSMAGNALKLVSNALKLFLQSLPEGSYYQIIGFGTNYIKYDEQPKKYIKQNIYETLEKINSLKANLGGTNIFQPLKDIFESYKIYEKLNLPINLFLLTDGEVNNKEDIFEIIEQNNNLFRIYSIGLGDNFDKDLIKNIGTLGKGNYNFCHDLNNLNSIIISELKSVCMSYITNFEIKTSLKDTNKLQNISNNNIIKENELFYSNYILDKKESEQYKNINVDIKFIDYNKKEIKKHHMINPIEFPKGEELSKLIIYDYIRHNKNLDKNDIIKLALKYQLLTKYTSLFAEIELSNKISEEMKLQILGNHNNNNEIINNSELTNHTSEEKSVDTNKINFFEQEKENFVNEKFCINQRDLDLNRNKNKKREENNNSQEIVKNKSLEQNMEQKQIDDNINEDEHQYIFDDETLVIKINLSNKADIMEMINTQDFIKGFWEENKYTKLIKDKYIDKYNLLKNMKISDEVAITILVILFIENEHKELLNELYMIIKKSKIFIRKETNDTYENLIKKILN